MSRLYFLLCLAVGWLLRTVRYSEVRLVSQAGELRVQKHRALYAPLLIWMGNLLLRTLDAGVRVLPQRDWEERERLIYQRLRRAPIRVDAGGSLVLPRLSGKTLASVLESPALEPSVREQTIESAVVALAQLHQLGFTHADAMAENVLVDVEAAAAHWLDFETIHDPGRPMAWRRADDVRALLGTCLVRTVPEKRAGILQLVLDVYSDEQVTRLLATSFVSVLQRPLAFHLAQAGLSFQCYSEVARLLSERVSRGAARFSAP